MAADWSLEGFSIEEKEKILAAKYTLFWFDNAIEDEGFKEASNCLCAIFGGSIEQTQNMMSGISPKLNDSVAEDIDTMAGYLINSPDNPVPIKARQELAKIVLETWLVANECGIVLDENLRGRLMSIIKPSGPVKR